MTHCRLSTLTAVFRLSREGGEMALASLLFPFFIYA